jgi:ABC-type multidrug transport system ATPase subunit
MDFKGDVTITANSKELKIFTVDGTRFNRLLRRIFSGMIKSLAKKGFKGKILVKDIDISIKKSKNRYLYICQPGNLPREKAVKDLLTFYCHWSGWNRRHRQPEEKKNLLSKPEKLAPIMNKRIAKLGNVKQGMKKRQLNEESRKCS